MTPTTKPPYTQLLAWQACFSLAVAVYRVTSGWPKSELYGMTSQARRAAYSAGANIAEGYAKRGAQELRRYLDISCGSLSELGFAMLLAREVGLLPAPEWQQIDAQIQRASQLVGGLMRALRRTPPP